MLPKKVSENLLPEGASAVNLPYFPSFPMGLPFRKIRFLCTNSGLGLPTPKGSSASICLASSILPYSSGISASM